MFTLKRVSICLCHRRFLCISSNSSFENLSATIRKSLPRPTVLLNDFSRRSDDLAESLVLRKDSRTKNIIREIKNIMHMRSEKEEELLKVLISLPNYVHSSIKNYKTDFETIKLVGSPKSYVFEPLSGTELLKSKDFLHMDGLVSYCGERSYYLAAELAHLEAALVDYTIDKLLAKGFELISVPNVICEDVIQRCGMNTRSDRTHVYRLDSKKYGDGWCLSGTSEIPIVAFLSNKNFSVETLPLKFVASSRCFRAEMSSTASEKGLYRVHQFTKVEMFGVCMPEQSVALMELFLQIEEELFTDMELHYRVIDMAPHELGHQAYRKYDIEAWMPGIRRFGEITSLSDCTDYQSKRLNIRSGETYLHTVNGTACAIPRIVNAIVETHQLEKGRVSVPPKLRPYLTFDVLGMRRGPRTHYLKNLPRKIVNID